MISPFASMQPVSQRGRSRAISTSAERLLTVRGHTIMMITKMVKMHGNGDIEDLTLYTRITHSRWPLVEVVVVRRLSGRFATIFLLGRLHLVLRLLHDFLCHSVIVHTYMHSGLSTC